MKEKIPINEVIAFRKVFVRFAVTSVWCSCWLGGQLVRNKKCMCICVCLDHDVWNNAKIKLRAISQNWFCLCICVFIWLPIVIVGSVRSYSFLLHKYQVIYRWLELMNAQLSGLCYDDYYYHTTHNEQYFFCFSIFHSLSTLWNTK